MVHQGMQQQFGTLYDVVLDILYRADLARVHSPDQTEYGPETNTILPMLCRCATVEDVHNLIYSQFCQWFTPSIAGPYDNYRHAAEQIFEAWILHQPII